MKTQKVIMKSLLLIAIQKQVLLMQQKMHGILFQKNLEELVTIVKSINKQQLGTLDHYFLVIKKLIKQENTNILILLMQSIILSVMQLLKIQIKMVLIHYGMNIFLNNLKMLNQEVSQQLFYSTVIQMILELNMILQDGHKQQVKKV